MLLEFRVENYKSFRDEAIFSLVASKDKHLESSHTQKTGINSPQSSLRSAAIFGQNAGGKSNLISAMQTMRAIVLKSANLMPEQKISVAKPFLLNAHSKSKPTSFEATFISQGVRYQYRFSILEGVVVEEYLNTYLTAKPQSWIKRKCDQKKDVDLINFSPNLQGEKSLWKKSTKKNSLVLSVAVNLNSQSLFPVYEWFAKLTTINEREKFSVSHSMALMENDDFRREVLSFIKAADISISDIKIVKEKGNKTEFKINSEGKDPEVVTEENVELKKLILTHESSTGDFVEFELYDESTGTRELLSLIPPILNILRNGSTLVIDEIDSSLHPLLVRRLIKIFNDHRINKNGAQLIFTLHNTNILDQNSIRRDQIWFIEKGKDQESKLFSLLELEARNSEAFESRYLTGRYGGLPFLEDWEPSH